MIWRTRCRWVIDVERNPHDSGEPGRPCDGEGDDVCETCGGTGLVTVHGGGSGDPEWDADDQPCEDCASMEAYWDPPGHALNVALKDIMGGINGRNN